MRRDELTSGVREKADLANKVDELVLNNEYQLRLKDMQFKEELLQHQEKYSAELEIEGQKYDALNDKKKKMEVLTQRRH